MIIDTTATRVGGFVSNVITVRTRNYRNYSDVSAQSMQKQYSIVTAVVTVGSRNCRNYTRDLAVRPTLTATSA
jgi:hypothetical protein